jgi:uncharacterized membrane protein YccC
LLTVAILTGRQGEPAAVKTTQRAIGTALGVVVAGLCLRLQLPLWALILLIGLLAGLRPLLRNRNYLAYSVVMTPLVILIIDAGRTPENGILVDRLAATLIGALQGLRLLLTPMGSRPITNHESPITFPVPLSAGRCFLFRVI